MQAILPSTEFKMNARWLVVALVLMFVAGTFAGSVTKMSPRKSASFRPLGDDCDVCIGLINTDIQILVDAIAGTYLKLAVGSSCGAVLKKRWLRN